MQEEPPPRRPPPEAQDGCGEPTIPDISSHERNRKPIYEANHKKELEEFFVSNFKTSFFI